MGDPRDLDEHELSAHSTMLVHLYGNESVRIVDICGDVAATAYAQIKLKNLQIAGSLPRLLAAFETMASLVADAIDNPDVWDSVPERQRRLRKQGKGLDMSLDGWGPFVATIKAPGLRLVED